MGLRYPDFNHTLPDKVIHSRVRLAILSALAHSEEVDFSSLKHAVGTTDGNLSKQIQQLESAGYIAAQQTLSGTRKQTNIALTNLGRTALLKYKKLINQWINLD